MVWPSWLWIGTPLKFSLWLANRFATWTGAIYCWKRSRSRRLVWVWILLIHLASAASLVLIFFCLR